MIGHQSSVAPPKKYPDELRARGAESQLAGGGQRDQGQVVQPGTQRAGGHGVQLPPWIATAGTPRAISSRLSPDLAELDDEPYGDSVTCVDGDPAQLAGGTGELGFDLPSGEWARELERLDAGSYIEILVPLTSDNEHATGVRRLRKARKLIRHNHLEEALGEARKAVEAIRAAESTSDTVRQAGSKARRDRDQRERWAFLVEDVFSLLSGAAHDDPGTTEHFVWTREDVLALVTATAGLLNRRSERAEQ